MKNATSPRYRCYRSKSVNSVACFVRYDRARSYSYVKRKLTQALEQSGNKHTVRQICYLCSGTLQVGLNNNEHLGFRRIFIFSPWRGPVSTSRQTFRGVFTLYKVLEVLDHSSHLHQSAKKLRTLANLHAYCCRRALTNFLPYSPISFIKLNAHCLLQFPFHR